MKDNVLGGAITETTLLVLLGFTKKNYGYNVMQWINSVTDGRVIIGIGTLYGAINTLIKKGWLEEDGKDGRRVFYKTSIDGYQQILNEIERMEHLLALCKRAATQY